MGPLWYGHQVDRVECPPYNYIQELYLVSKVSRDGVWKWQPSPPTIWSRVGFRPDIVYRLSFWFFACLAPELLMENSGAHVGHFIYLGEVIQILGYLGASEPFLERMSLIWKHLVLMWDHFVRQEFGVPLFGTFLCWILFNRNIDNCR